MGWSPKPPQLVASTILGHWPTRHRCHECLDHPTPHDLNQIEIGRVWWTRRQTIKLPSLFGHLGPFVLRTAVVNALLSYQLPYLILLILSRGVADDVDTVLCVVLADYDVIVRCTRMSPIMQNSTTNRFREPWSQSTM